MKHNAYEGWAARRQLSVNEARKQLREIELAAKILLEVFNDIDAAVIHGQLIKRLSEGANSTACRMDNFLEWLQACKIIKRTSDHKDESIISLNMYL